MGEIGEIGGDWGDSESSHYQLPITHDPLPIPNPQSFWLTPVVRKEIM